MILLWQLECILLRYLRESWQAHYYQCMHYLFLHQPHPSSRLAGSEDFQEGRAEHTAAVSPAQQGRQIGSSTWTPAVKSTEYSKVSDGRMKCFVQLLCYAPQNKRRIFSLRISMSLNSCCFLCLFVCFFSHVQYIHRKKPRQKWNHNFSQVTI